LDEPSVDLGVSQRKQVALVVASPATITAFMQEHINAWLEHCDVTIFVGTRKPISFRERTVSVSVNPICIERDIKLWRDLIALCSLFRSFRKKSFDAVVSVTPKAGILAMLASWLCRVPVRVHIFTGQVWATRRGLTRVVLRRVDRLTSALATDVLVDSESQRQFMISEKVTIPRHSRVLAHGSISGVDLQRFRPDAGARARIRKSLALVDEDVLLLFVGRLNKEKGVLDLAAAFSELTCTYSLAHLMFLGADEEEILPQIHKICGSALARIHFEGHTDSPEDYMAASDVLCLPSYREGFGTVLIEAAAVGIPAVASKIYGITDAVVDGVTGLLHPPGDVKALHAALDLLVNDPVRRAALGSSARARVVKLFSSTVVVKAYSDYIFQRLGIGK
jgi:glycosyltransferase involved in cell wall biosynthesis